MFRRGLILAIAMLAAVSATPAPARASQHYSFTDVADSAGPYQSFLSGPPTVNERGQVAFIATLDNAESGVFVWSRGEPTRTVIDSTGSFDSFESAPGLPINNAGQLAFIAGGGGTHPRYVTADVNGNVQTIITFDGQPFGSAGTSLALNDSGTVVFDARTGEADSAIYRRDPGGQLVTVIDGSGILAEAFGPQINNAGQIGFTASLDAGGGGMFRRESDGSLTTIFDRGGRVQAINDSGVLAINSRVAGDWGLYLADGGTPELVAELSDGFDALWQIDVNSSGDIAFAAIAAGDVGTAIFTGSDPVGDRVIGPGDQLFGGIVESCGFRGGLNDVGEIAFAYHLTNGQSGIALAVVPEPSLLAPLLLLLLGRSARVRRRWRIVKGVIP